MVSGDVHAIRLPRRRGHVQHGRRFAVIVQADDLLALSTIVVCPTSTSTPPASFHLVTCRVQWAELLSEFRGERVQCRVRLDDPGIEGFEAHVGVAALLGVNRCCESVRVR